jgi:hypothetical protein
VRRRRWRRNRYRYWQDDHHDDNLSVMVRRRPWIRSIQGAWR